EMRLLKENEIRLLEKKKPFAIALNNREFDENIIPYDDRGENFFVCLNCGLWLAKKHWVEINKFSDVRVRWLSMHIYLTTVETRQIEQMKLMNPIEQMDYDGSHEEGLLAELSFF
ncbi:MAG: hypothetical protein O2897_05625, partial [bacterium]|nr:hypothetical protein [bacterium]